MKVSDIMTRTAASCTPEMNLGAVVEIFWNRNCGILPVVDDQGRVVSVITDRDICIALGTRNRLAGELTVGDVATKRAICCSAEEDVHSVLAKIGEARVRRLPVIDAQGRLEGLISMDDVVDRTHLKATVRGNELTSEDVLETLKKLYAGQLPSIIGKTATA